MNMYVQYRGMRLNKTTNDGIQTTARIYIYVKTCNWNYTRNQKKFLLQPNISRLRSEYKQY